MTRSCRVVSGLGESQFIHCMDVISVLRYNITYVMERERVEFVKGFGGLL